MRNAATLALAGVPLLETLIVLAALIVLISVRYWQTRDPGPQRPWERAGALTGEGVSWVVVKP